MVGRQDDWRMQLFTIIFANFIHSMFTSQELHRYSRQILLSELGQANEIEFFFSEKKNVQIATPFCPSETRSLVIVQAAPMGRRCATSSPDRWRAG